MEYSYSDPPNDPSQLQYFLINELQKLQQSLVSKKPFIRLETTNVAPSNPREGDIVLADGTDWNPGAGVGFYGYHSSTWNKLG